MKGCGLWFESIEVEDGSDGKPFPKKDHSVKDAGLDAWTESSWPKAGLRGKGQSDCSSQGEASVPICCLTTKAEDHSSFSEFH